MPVARVVAYYILLIAGTILLVRLFPDPLSHLFNAERMEELSRLPGRHGDLSVWPVSRRSKRRGHRLRSTARPRSPPGLAMVGATLLMLPVTWIYIMTRRRKGFRQSVVQTLIILPIVVAGVVFMVKNSLALAFSLGGIVAAVSFRNTLRDTKDAVYIFLAHRRRPGGRGSSRCRSRLRSRSPSTSSS